MESRRRSFVKMVIYRGIITVVLAVITWIFTGNTGETTLITIVFSISATAIYYVHERIWARVKWA